MLVIVTFRNLVRDKSGVAMIELVLCLPILLIVVLGTMELAHYAMVREQLSALALQIADNAGRLGEQRMTGPERISEAQINDVLLGGAMQSASLALEENGRIVLSSLERNKDEGQWIHWQRCKGRLAHPSSYGLERTGEFGTAFAGMGPASSRITAGKNLPVMFAEVAYNYKAIALPQLVPAGPIVEYASAPVRIDRDTSGLTNGEKAKRSTC